MEETVRIAVADLVNQGFRTRADVYELLDERDFKHIVCARAKRKLLSLCKSRFCRWSGIKMETGAAGVDGQQASLRLQSFLGGSARTK